PDRRQAVRSVRDEGAGIDPALLPRLSTPFEQADRSLDRSQGGLGLGLALVKGLAELHGGAAAAASEGPGKGAEFTVRLPLESEPATAAGAPCAARAAGQKYRILVLEDNADTANSLRTLLELFGHDVRVAYTGPDGLKLAAGWQPQI